MTTPLPPPSDEPPTAAAGNDSALRAKTDSRAVDSVWQYWVVSVSTMSQKLSQTLNDLGSAGWEVVGFAASDKTLGLNEYRVILKRRGQAFAPPSDLVPGWHPDPAGRHQLRWWDGVRWEQHVLDDGKADLDWPTPPVPK